VWHQEFLDQPDPEPGIYNENADADYSLYARREFYGSSANLPALLPAKTSTKRNLVSFILACVTIMLVTLMLQNDLNYNHLSNSLGIGINNVQIKNQEEIGKIAITYDIVNNSTSKAKIPLVKIRLFDKNHRIIVTHITDQNPDILEPGQSVNIKKEGANVILLDEPSNDLDVDTLRALEDAILDFAGCVFVISHDRWFLDRIATHIIAFDKEGDATWFEGNYQDYHDYMASIIGQDTMNPKYRHKRLV